MAVTHTTTFRNIVADLVTNGCDSGKLVQKLPNIKPMEVQFMPLDFDDEDDLEALL